MIVLLLSCSTEPDWTEQRALTPALVALDTDKNGRVEAKEYDGVRYHARPFTDVDTDKDGALSIGELTELFFRSDPGNSGLGPEGGARRNKAKRDAAKKAGSEQGVPPPGGGGPAASQGGAGPGAPGADGPAANAPAANAPAANGPAANAPAANGPAANAPAANAPAANAPAANGPAANAPAANAAAKAGPPPGRPGLTDTNGTGDKRVFPSEIEVRTSLIAATLHVLESLREELLYAGHDAPPEADLEAAANAGTLYTVEARAVLDRLETASDAAGLGFPPSLRRAALATRPVDPSLPPVEPAQ